MAPVLFRLVWGNPPVPAGRWHGGLVNLKVVPALGAATGTSAAERLWHDYRRHRLHLSVRGLLLWFAAFALGCYLAGVAVVLHRLRTGNPHNRVAYLDLVVPTRWRELDRLRGQALAGQGRALLADGRFREGFPLLRLGLARNPSDHATRLDLARVYVSLRLAPRARKLLLEGLAHGYPGREFLDYAFGLAAEADDASARADLARRARERFDALPAGDRSAEEALWLDANAAKAFVAAGRPEEALALAENGYPEQHPFRREITVLRLLETGRAVDAAALAARWAAEAPRSDEALRLLVRACREAGDSDGMDAALARLRALAPQHPGALLYAMTQHQLAGRAEAAGAALEELLFRHGADSSLYPAAAAVSVELRRTDFLDRLESELRDRGLSPGPVTLARLRLAATRLDWPRVLAHAAALRAGPAAGAEASAPDGMAAVERLARACLDGASGVQADLVDHLAAHPGPARLYASFVEALLAAGRAETADRVLALAEGPFPDSDQLAALRPRVGAALAAAEPSDRDLPERAGPAPASVEELLARCDECIRSNDTEGALALLATARRARPDWLAAAEPRLEAFELPLRARGDDPLRLRLLVRSDLARDPRAPDRLLALARRMDAEAPGLRANAVLLVKEILRVAPAHAAALDQLAVWEPRSGDALAGADR